MASGSLDTGQLSEGLGDRGIGVQAAGFVVVGCMSLFVLQWWSGSEHFLYHGFEVLVTKLYWAFIVPLAATFDWMRKMFEKGKAIREAKKAEILAKVREQVTEQVREQVTEQVREQVTEQVREQVTEQVREQVTQQVRREEHERIKAQLEMAGVSLTPEVAARVFNTSSDDD